MTRIALLRGINVGTAKQVAMSDLKTLFTKLGLEDVQSLLRTGNLVFRGGARSGAQLEKLLETETKTRLGLETDYFVRTAEEWKATIAQNPFPKEAKDDPALLLVMFLKDAPDAKAVKALQAAIVGREVVRVHGREAYIVFPDGVGRSRLTTALIDKKLGTRGTGRNWNTVLRIGTLAGL